MNADLWLVYYLGGLCALFLVIAPLVMLARIMNDMRKIRDHLDRIYYSGRTNE
jgi:hypothetical protein